MTATGLNVAELVELALLLVAVGAVSGFFAGIFGIGGGAILVPVFYECFRLAGVPLEVRMPLCIGTSLAIIIPTSIRSFRAHYARGAVDLEILKQWWLPIVIGVIAGSITARYAPERLFKIVFVMVAWSAAARLLLARDNWKFGDEVPPAVRGRISAGRVAGPCRDPRHHEAPLVSQHSQIHTRVPRPRRSGRTGFAPFGRCRTAA
jgi:uncharacterized membrane protein YfcA